MTYKEIAKLLQIRYGFVNEPNRKEIDNILSEITQYTTESDFDKIVYKYIEDTLSSSNESLDMSSTINILEQIKMALKSK